MKQDARRNAPSLSRFVTIAPPLFLVVILALVPLAHPGPNAIRLLFISLVWITASVGWNILGGFAGQVSFGFAVFYGLGAYATAISLNAGLDRLPSLALAALVGATTSLLVGLPTFRLRGPYFAIATIGVSEAVRVVMTNLAVTGGASGYRITEKGAFNQRLHFYVALGLAAGAVAISMLIRHSKLGLALISIREDEDAASDLGVNPYATKLLTHALAAALTAAAGGVYAGYSAFVHPNGVFGFDISVAILLMPIIGGIGTVWGPVIGAVVYGLVQEELIASFPQFHLFLYGALLILIILFEPGGVLGLINQLIRFVKARTGVGAHT
jgi:branched-chain amino acid transport system permease protein